METKEELVSTIKEWLKNDNMIKSLQKEIKARKIQNEVFSKKLIDTMRVNEIDSFDINTGKIVYSKKTIKKPITKKLLSEVLKKYYVNDADIATEVEEFILSSRETVVRENLTLKTAALAPTDDR
jgi:hypothetical protein